MNKRISKRKEYDGSFTCSICHKKFKGTVYDPRPIKSNGICCEECYSTKVFEEKKKIIESWRGK